MCKLLANKYDMIHCGENYLSDCFLDIAVPELQPNMCYLKNKNWQDFVNRTPEEYAAWIDNNSHELAEFEIVELIRISEHKKVIVDTNIPLDVLKQIADYNQVAIMLSPQSMSVESFFERDDPEKQFLLDQIRQAENPAKTMENFKACLGKINSKEKYQLWVESGFFTVIREQNKDTRLETLAALANHFGLEE